MTNASAQVSSHHPHCAAVCNQSDYHPSPSVHILISISRLTRMLFSFCLISLSSLISWVFVLPASASEMHIPTLHRLNFDIDSYLNPYIPRSRLYRLPKPISRFLGYRDRPQQGIGNIVSWAWSFLGAFSGIALIEGVIRSSPLIQSHAPPVIIGSFVRPSPITPGPEQLPANHRI